MPKAPAYAAPAPAAPLIDAMPGEIAFSPKRYRKFELSDAPSAIALGTDGSRLAVAVNKGRRIEEYDVHTSERLAAYYLKKPATVLAYAPGGTLAAGTGSSGIALFSSGMETGTLKTDSSGVTALAFSASGQSLAAGFRKGAIEVFDMSFGDRTASLDGHGREVLSLAFMPDGRTLVSMAGDLVSKFWDLGTGRETRSFKSPEDRGSGAALSADGQVLAISAKEIEIDLARGRRTDKRFVVLRSTASGEELRRIPAESDITTLGFHPNRRYIFTATADGSVSIWDTSNGKAVNAIEMGAAAGGVAMSLDGSMVAHAAGGTVTVLRLAQ